METEIHEKRGYLLEDFRLFHLRDAQGTKVDYHYHEFHKLLLMVSGNGIYVVEGKRYELRPGDVVLVGSHCVHKPEFEPGVAYERIILYISPQFLRDHSRRELDLEACFSGEKGYVLRPGQAQYRDILRRMEELEQELGNKGWGWEIASQGQLLGLCVALRRAMNRQDITYPEPVEPQDRRIREMLAYLDQHLEEDVSIDELAKTFYISKYHMMRLFRQETGTTIHGYLTDKRLLRARDRIRQGMPATEACFQSGFQSYSAFLRAYSKFFGVTPMGRGRKGQEELYE